MTRTRTSNALRRVTALAAAVLLISMVPAAAAKATSFTAPYSGSSAFWGCQPECHRLGFETQQSASKDTGEIVASATLSAPAFNTAGANLFAAGLVEQMVANQAKPLSSTSATVDYTIASASTALAGTQGGSARVLLIVSLWNAGCQCEATETVVIAETDGDNPPSFSGSRSVTVQLATPGERSIKGTLFIRAQIRVEASLTAQTLMGATNERSARAEARGVVTRIAYTG